MQKTAYEMRISDGSSDVCSSDLIESQDRLPRDRERRAADHADTDEDAINRRGRQSGTQHHLIERDRAEFRSRIAAQITVKLAEWGAGDAIHQNMRRAHAWSAFGKTDSCLIAAKSDLPSAVLGSSFRQSHCLCVRVPYRTAGG